MTQRGPDGQQLYIGTARVGPKGQIVIPKEVRDMFDIKPGDSVMILADSTRGIAIERASTFAGIANAIIEGKGKEVYPDQSEEDSLLFAENIQKTLENDDD